ncbi:type II secretion system protein [Planctomycetota bacterium]
MERKGFTLVELLVVIAIIALLMGILMPALSKVRQIAYRMVCGTNLSGIGKAMTLYANDFFDELPRSGGRSSQWRNEITDFAAPTRIAAYGLADDESGGFGSITSSMYLLIKYTEVSPKSFICKSDSSVREFSLDDTALPRDTELKSLWDFGPEPREHVSYGYHFPFNNAYSLTTSSDPGMAVAADRNPWIEDSTDIKKDFSLFVDPTSQTGAMLGNSPSHQDESQNVLYVDVHVSQEKTSLCGVNKDNIYTKADGTSIGIMPVGGDASLAPTNNYDSLLVNDGSGSVRNTGRDSGRN